MENNGEFLYKTAEVIKKLPDNHFQVKFENGLIIRAKTAKRLKKMVAGDYVIVKISPRDLTNGQIIKLTKKKEGEN